MADPTKKECINPSSKQKTSKIDTEQLIAIKMLIINLAAFSPYITGTVL